MQKRFMAIWFRHLMTDWLTIRRPKLKELPLVLSQPEHGKMIISATSALAEIQGIRVGMAVADARAIVPTLEVLDDRPRMRAKLLRALGEWSIRYTPIAAVDMPDGIFMDVSGCAHLWGGERPFFKEIVNRLKGSGYDVRAAMADTIGTAWAIARYGQISPIINSHEQTEALLSLPPAALRLEPAILEKLYKLGLHQIRHFIHMPRTVLRRRFGETMLTRLDQAIGKIEEFIEPIQRPEPFQERLPCLEPISTAIGIEIALKQVLNNMCDRLQKEGKGIRSAVFSCFRMDGKVEKIEIGTNSPTHNVNHLFKLFELKIESIEPALGIEVFLLEAPKIEPLQIPQETIWSGSGCLEDTRVLELIDRLSGKFGNNSIHRYLPAEHYWPERSYALSSSLLEKPFSAWRADHPRPIQLLPEPIPVQVSAPIPDYPPMLFRYRDKVYNIKKADGPERIECEWWLEESEHRDYYIVEDEEGVRYWLFRSGHYQEENQQWYIHGLFA